MSTSKSCHRPEIRLRTAEIRDVTSILELETACFARAEEAFNRRQVYGLVVNPRATVILAESKGHVVGWAAGLLRRHRHYYSGRLYALAVHPDMQGKRIGNKLIGRIFRELAARGARRIFLEVHTGNQKAIHLYRKFGFADQEYLADYYGPGHHGLRMMRPATATHRPRS